MSVGVHEWFPEHGLKSLLSIQRVLLFASLHVPIEWLSANIGIRKVDSIQGGRGTIQHFLEFGSNQRLTLFDIFYH